MRQLWDRVFHLKHEGNRSLAVTPEDPPAYDEVVRQNQHVAYAVEEEECLPPFEVESTQVRPELETSNPRHEMEAWGYVNPAELETLPTRKVDRPQEAFSFANPGLPRKVPVRQPRYSEATSSSFNSFGSSVFDSSQRRETSTTQNTSIYSQNSISELPGNTISDFKGKSIDRRPQLHLDTGMSASNMLAVPIPSNGKGSAVSSASEVSIITGEALQILESPDSLLPPAESGETSRQAHPGDGEAETSLLVSDVSLSLGNRDYEREYSDKIVSPQNHEFDRIASGMLLSFPCECHELPELPLLASEVPGSFSARSRQEHIRKSAPIETLGNMDLQIQANIHHSWQVANASGLDPMFLNPIMALRPSLTHALSCLDYVQRGSMPFDNQEIVSFLFLAYNVLEFLATSDEKFACQEVFFAQALVWIEAIDDPELKSALDLFVNIVWLPEVLRHHCAHGHRWPCAIQRFCPKTTLPFSVAAQAKAAAAGSESRRLLKMLQESSLTIVCIHFLQGKSGLKVQPESKLTFKSA